MVKQNNETNVFNILRVSAAMMVFVGHVKIFATQLLNINCFGRLAIGLNMPAWGGVWIFLILSGYLTGKGYMTGRYQLSKAGIFDFYVKKLIKIGIPTYFFIFLCCVLVYPTFVFDDKSVLWKIITFTYNGIPGVNGIGATWYVSCIMQLYTIAPIFAAFLNYTKKNSEHGNKVFYLLFSGVIIIGFLFRIFMYKNGIDWYKWVYTFSVSNIDLFFGGMILSYIEIANAKERKRPVIWVAFVILIFLNCYIIYSNRAEYLWTYMYMLPSAYGIVVGMIFLFYGKEEFVKGYVGVSIKLLSEVSFQFYLWHSLVLHTTYAYYTSGSPIFLYIKLLIGTFIITLLIALFFTRSFNSIVRSLEQKQKSIFVESKQYEKFSENR